MKKVISIISLVFYSVSLALGSGQFVTPGARAEGMGGAYVAIADDATAIYWNPAGLAQLEGTGVEVSAFTASSKIKSNKSLKSVLFPGAVDSDGGDFPLNHLYANEPTEYNSKEVEVSSLLPFVAGYKKVKNITIGAGFYVVGGGGGKWSDSLKDTTGVDDITAKIDATLGYVVGNISAAKELNEKLSLGLGINLIYLMDNLEIQKTYKNNSGSIFTPDYTVDLENKATGTGVELTGGALYRLKDNLRLGFVLRTGGNINVKGTAKVVGTGAAAGFTTESDYTKNYAYPLTYGLGVAYDYSEKLTIAAGIDRNDYSVMKTDVDYDNESALLADTNTQWNWKDTTQIRLGAEYKANDKLALRAGVFTDPNPCPTDKMTLINTNQYNKTMINLGAGYMLSEAMRLDFTFIHVMSDEPEKDGTTYEYPLNAYRLGMGYMF